MAVDVAGHGRLPCLTNTSCWRLAVVACLAVVADAVPLRAQMPPGLVANFRFSGYVHNSARPTPGLEAATPRFAPDRFGNAG